METNPEVQPIDPAMVRYLRVLVTVLSATMIIGFIIIVALFVTRFAQEQGTVLPDAITLPPGAAPAAFTQGADWYAVVTQGDEILIYDRTTGELRQTIRIDLSK